MALERVENIRADRATSNVNGGFYDFLLGRRSKLAFCVGAPGDKNDGQYDEKLSHTFVVTINPADVKG